MGTRQSVVKDAVPIELWPTVLDVGFEEGQRRQFRAQAEAMRLYFSWVPIDEIERRTGVHRCAVPRLAKRCLQLAEDGRIQGFRACIPFSRVEPYVRTLGVSHVPPGERAGMAGALGALLKRFPDIDVLLIKYVKNEAKRLAISEHKLRPCDLHRLFLKCLVEKGVSRSEWPFNTKYLGLRSIQAFMKETLERHFARCAAAREDSIARAHLNVGKGVASLLRFDEPYDAVEIDTYKIEAHVTVAFHTPEGLETDLRLDRLNLIAVVDRFSSAVLAYTVVYRPEVNADDILRVIRDAAGGTWAPMELSIPELRYPEGGGLPSGVIPGAQGALWSATMFDGALAHLSNAVHARARAALGFAINWGPVAHFERRPNVERTFNQIARALFKRLPSTTGTNPHSGRADEAERKAIEHRIRAADVEQLLDVTFAQHNATPSEGLSNLTPLEAVRYYFDQPERFESRKRPAGTADAGFALYESPVVRGSRSSGRRPYIQVDRVRYTNEVLACSGHLIGSRLLLEIDEDDMRQVKAYLANGAELGVLKAHGKWGITKHSRRTRKVINSLITRRLITITTFDDPLQVYMKHLASSRKSARATPRPGPKQATEIVRVRKESGQDPRTIEAPQRGPAVDTPARRVVDEVRGRLLSEPPAAFFTKVKNRR
ncbi:hypothetical protein [Massilia sp. YMA4]|uniref:hypothetical protein n=1 Tax=Massilia sp. YMA4 TaxID=1593482 RepID=UPI001877C069|nr:hypothetical protein [Massilia sp. YMA4]